MLSTLPGSPNSLSASWLVPEPANGIISGYTISCSTPSEVLMPFGIASSLMATSLEGLTAFTNYTCIISATTGAGTGNLSNPQTARTDEDGKSRFRKVYAYCQGEV